MGKTIRIVTHNLNDRTVGQIVEINGDNVPNTRTGEAIRVDWAVEGTDKSGTIPAGKVTSNISRIDIAADALDELTFVFEIGGASVEKTTTLIEE